MKKITFINLFLWFLSIGYAQDLYIGPDSLVTIQSNASLNVNGLILEPNTNYTLDSDTNFQRTASPAETGNLAINRQFNITPELINYTGTLIFNYKDNELNGVIEEELQLQTYNNVAAIWTSYLATLDTNINRLTYNFIAETNLSIVTADQRQNLSVETLEIDFAFDVYPNPTNDIVYIKYPLPIKTTLHSTTGQLLFKGNSKTVDLSMYEGATYFLTVQDIANKNKKIFKLIKN